MLVRRAFFLGAKVVGHVIWRVGGAAARVYVMGFAVLPMLYDPQQLWLLIVSSLCLEFHGRGGLSAILKLIQNIFL